MCSANYQDVLDPVKVPTLPHAREEFQVLLKGHAFIEPSSLFNARPPHEDRLDDVVLFPEEIIDSLDVGHAAGSSISGLKVEPLVSAVDNTQPIESSGIRAEDLHLSPQLRGEPEIIIVEKGNELPVRARDPGIARGRRPAFQLSQDVPNRPREPRNDPGILFRVVGGIIDHKHFKVAVVLTNHGPQRVGEVPGTIPGRDDDRNLRHVRPPRHQFGASRRDFAA